MTLQEAISLIDNDYLRGFSPSVRGTPKTEPIFWADLGSGSGLFTHALCHFLPAGSIVYAIDQQNSLKRQTTPAGVEIIPLTRDFVKDALLPSYSPGSNNIGNSTSPLLKGILMANSFHYIIDKAAFLQTLKPYFVPNPVFLIVEYDIDIPVPTWVPYPVSFSSLQNLFREAGYPNIQKISTRPSSYGRGNMYSALIQ